MTTIPDKDFEFFNSNPTPTQIREYMAWVRREAYTNGYNAGVADRTGKPLLEVENVRIVGGVNADGESFTCCFPCCN